MSRTWTIALFALFLAGCTKNPAKDPKTLVIAIESDIKMLDVRFAQDANSSHVWSLFAQSLVGVGEDFQPVAELAKSFSSSDNKNYFFEVPADAKFQDGTPLTSKDVKASFEQAAAPESRIHSNFIEVESFKAPTPTTFEIHLKKPDATFLISEVVAVRIMPEREAMTKDPVPKPVGSGPYRFTGKEGRDLVFERSPYFQPAPFYDRILVRSIEDPSTRFLSIVGGEADVVFNGMAPRRVAEAEKNPLVKVYRGVGNSFQYIGLNLKNEKFKDHRVREALSIGVDRADLIEHKLLGYAKSATSILSPGNAYRNEKLSPVAYDPERAKHLLKQAGASHLEFELKCSSDRDVVSLLSAIKEQWERLGLKIKLQPFEFGTFFSQIQNGNFEAFQLRWTAVISPDLLFKVFHSKETPPGKNRVSFASKEFDSLVERAVQTADFAGQKKLYDQAQDIVFREIPYVPLWYPDNVVVASSRIKNFHLHPSGTWKPILSTTKDPLSEKSNP